MAKNYEQMRGLLMKRLIVAVIIFCFTSIAIAETLWDLGRGIYKPNRPITHNSDLIIKKQEGSSPYLKFEDSSSNTAEIFKDEGGALIIKNSGSNAKIKLIPNNLQTGITFSSNGINIPLDTLYMIGGLQIGTSDLYEGEKIIKELKADFGVVSSSDNSLSILGDAPIHTFGENGVITISVDSATTNQKGVIKPDSNDFEMDGEILKLKGHPRFIPIPLTDIIEAPEYINTKAIIKSMWDSQTKIGHLRATWDGDATQENGFIYMVQLPADFNKWASPGIVCFTRISNNSLSIAMTIYDTEGEIDSLVNNQSITPSTINIWEKMEFSLSDTNNYNPEGWIRIKVDFRELKDGDYADFSKIYLKYISKF